MTLTRRNTALSLISLAGISATGIRPALAASASDLNRRGAQSLQTLYTAQPRAEKLAARSVGILVFPSIVKAGFIVGAQTGDGVLFINGAPAGYYNISAASFGLQAGAQSFAYALFFMNKAALAYLNQSDGWSIGSGPSVVVLDKGAASSVTSTTLSQDVYAVPYGQQGLMAGMGIEGSKITQINPGP